MHLPQVFAYYFPNWHPDPRNERWFGVQGWTEWDAGALRNPGSRAPSAACPR